MKSLIASIVFATVCVVLLIKWEPAHADEWTATNTNKELVWQALHVIDLGQTWYIFEHPNKYKETNPFLGEHPSAHRVENYFLGSAFLHYYLVRHIESAKTRDIVQNISIGFTLGAVANNWRLGVKLDY